MTSFMPNLERNHVIVERALTGESYAQLGRDFGLSRSRVQQLVRKYDPTYWRRGLTQGCGVDGCGKRHRAKGFCRLHYDRWRRHGDPLESGIRGRGIGPHPESFCVIEGCERVQVARGFCITHYQRMRGVSKQPLNAPIRVHGEPQIGPCSVAGCDRHRKHAGMCGIHYYRTYLRRARKAQAAKA